VAQPTGLARLGVNASPVAVQFAGGVSICAAGLQGTGAARMGRSKCGVAGVSSNMARKFHKAFKGSHRMNDKKIKISLLTVFDSIGPPLGCELHIHVVR
jgi:hypothetical protein